SMTEEHRRIAEATRRVAHWRRWGPYLSERQWGTVREDYSPGGTAWEYFPHDHARARAYRWGEDGLAGISDNHQRLCFALALWNGRDVILKERLFGLTGTQGNHGEDVKEYYFYLDNTPTHAYMKYLYKYPQRAFPYALLLEETARRDRRAREYELLDTGVFDDDRYFDVVVEYAKAAIDEMLIRIAVTNRGPEPADVHVLPTLWFRNTWTWEAGSPRPRLRATAPGAGGIVIEAEHATLGRRWLVGEGAADLLFTENETNARRLWGVANTTLYVKDAFHDYVVHGRADAVNPAAVGTKAGAHHRWSLRAGETRTWCRRRARPTRARWRGRRSRGSCGASSSTTWTSGAGSPAIRASPRPRASACTAATRTGRISTTKTCSRCPTSGSTRGMPPGTWPSTPSRSRRSIRTSPSHS